MLIKWYIIMKKLKDTFYVLSFLIKLYFCYFNIKLLFRELYYRLIILYIVIFTENNLMN